MAKKERGMVVPAIKKQRLTIVIQSISPMIQHKWDEKAKGMMREKHAGKKTKTREVRDPQAEGEAAAYRTADGRYGIPAMALKKSIIQAAHKDLGIEKTLVRKALFIRCDDQNMIIPIECAEPTIREDIVRVGTNQTDLRYRPYFDKWTATTEWEIDSELLRAEDVVRLVDRAGFGVGICDYRPEHDGESGRFEVATVSAS